MKSSKKDMSKKKSNSNYHRSGRWLEKPKREHRIVFEAVEIANKAMERVVSTDEVSQALLPKEKRNLENKYVTSLNNTVSKILCLLCRRGLIFSTEKIGGKRYYGQVGLLNPEDIDISILQSRRQRTFTLVRTAVIETGNALKIGEICEFAKKQSLFSDLNPTHIVQDVLSLKQTGEILVIPIRGDNKGFGIYLPADLNIEDFLPKEPVSWLEFVLDVFIKIWNEHKYEVEGKDAFPLPVTTGEVRAKISITGKFNEKLENPKDLISAMQQLAQTKSPQIKKIKRKGQKAILWVPMKIKQNEVNLGQAYAHDTERIEEAVRRASSRLGRPVDTKEIAAEINNDSSLEPVSGKKYHVLVADLSRKFIPATGNSRRNRIKVKIHQVGSLSGHAYFYPTNEPEAFAFVKHRLLEQKWELLNPVEEINNIERCILPTVAFGRLKLLNQEIKEISKELETLKGLKEILGVEQSERIEFINGISELLQRIELSLNVSNGKLNYLPETVNTKTPNLTVYEMTELIKPFYPRANNIGSNSSLQAYLGDSIRRIRNPDFKMTNAENSRFAAKYLYDKTDALIYIAKEWGGEESRLQATLAANELGLLRDPEFVIPALHSRDFNERLTAISCLAFLSFEDSLKKLRDLARNDFESGIRQSALWAYGLATGTNNESIDFIMQRSFQDGDSRVRSFARKLIEKSEVGWLFT